MLPTCFNVCKNCQFYAPGHHNECQETQAEWVSEKERSNFCDYFQVSEKDHKGLQKRSSVSKEKIKATFDQLFAEWNKAENFSLKPYLR